MLKMVYACNDKLFEGLYLSILSTLNRTKETIHFYCLTGDLTEIDPKYIGLTKKHQALINKLIKRYNKNNKFEVIDCANKYRAIFKKAKNQDIKKYTPYTMFRLMMEDFKQIQGVNLYIDIDTMLLGDVKEAFNVDMTNYEICACHDRNLKRKNKHTYFNAGVFLFNIDNVRKTHYFKKAMKYYLEKTPKLADQDALNATWTSITFWPGEFRFNYQKPRIDDDTIIKHFLNAARLDRRICHIKQWHIDQVHKILKIHAWDKDYEIFLRDKKQWEKE